MTNWGSIQKTNFIQNLKYVVGFKESEQAGDEVALNLHAAFGGFTQIGVSGTIQFEDGAGNSVVTIYGNSENFLAEQIQIVSFGFGEFAVMFVEPFFNPLTDFILFNPIGDVYSGVRCEMGFLTKTANYVNIFDFNGDTVDAGFVNFNCQIFKAIPQNV